MKKLRIVAPIVLSALLIGCTSSATKKEEEQKQKAIETQISKDDLLKVIDMEASSKNVDAATQISNAADSVSRSMDKLAKIQTSTHTMGHINNASPKQLKMPQLVSVDWSGPIEPLLQKIANASHYRLRYIGKKTALPIIVSVHVNHTPLGDVVQDVKYQTAPHGQLVVDPDQMLIEFRYYGA